LTAQHAGLDSRANGHHLVGVNTFVRLFAKQLAHRFLNGRHPGLPTDQDHLIDLTVLT